MSKKNVSKKSNAVAVAAAEVATDTVDNNQAATAVAEVASVETTDVSPTAAPVAAKKPRAKRTLGLMNYQAAQVTFLMDGFATLKQNFEDGKVTRPTLKRAAVEFKAKGRTGEDFDLLNDWVGDMNVAGERGRKALGAGEARRYKAQSVKDGPAFLHTPLAALGIKKGEEVTVEVSADGLSLYIRRASAVDVDNIPADDSDDGVDDIEEASIEADQFDAGDVTDVE